MDRISNCDFGLAHGIIIYHFAACSSFRGVRGLAVAESTVNGCGNRQPTYR